MRLSRLAIAVFLGLAVMVTALAQDSNPIPFPEGYRNWYHVRSTLNKTGHSPEGNIGIQHVYANALAVEGVRAGTFPDGAMFVVDRFKFVEGDNNTVSQGERKVIAVMLRDAQRYAETGGWGFEAFKAGDPNQRVVKDQKACFACHIPHADNNYLFTKSLN